MAFMAAGAPREGDDLVLVGMPPGGRHDLGALAFATTAKRAGISVRYLGADLPLEDWVEAVRRTRALAVVIGVVMRADIRAATEVARAVRAATPRTLIAFGGRRASAVAAEEIAASVVLPDDLAQAVSTLRDSLRATRTTS
jgi:methanogenic corrinoid protein MtbC1